MLNEKRIPIGYIFDKIKLDTAIVTGFTLVLMISIDNLASIMLKLTLPIGIPAFLGTAISLLLSFKLAQSYDRWWEARKIWGAIVNDSRTLVVQLKNFCKTEAHFELVKTIAYRQIAWCYELSCHLRSSQCLVKGHEFLTPAEANALKKSTNIPLALLDSNAQSISNLLDQKAINDFQHIQLDNTLVRLCASMGKCERIKNTVFPRTYRMFLHLFIYIFVFTLAISLSELHSTFELGLLVIISLPFFLLEKTAFHMQDPFENRPTDTAMNTISQAIEVNIKELLGESNSVPKDTSEESFYIM